ncbi:MAG: alanine racemase [Candidatus Omnitrophica bacterium]|nr:alanine racemase [Candidatus Omnitrophota bacterium]MBU1038015.1 alanine racemase [Candidatus Omnitrophota bacterium]MBU1808754.1 alanine racemase [Candidatus Omnitrophota bacterium]
MSNLEVKTRNGVTHTHHRSTWAEIDLKAIEYNYRQVRKHVGKGINIMAVVKANAYGHGTVEVSNALERSGVDYLGVATTDEAVRLRDHGIKCPILVLSSVLPVEVGVAVEKDITLSICDEELFDVIRKESARGGKLKVHIKIDTGMGRVGIWHEEALNLVKKVSAESGMILEGIYTHFSSAGRDDFFTTYQIEAFEKLLSSIEKNWIKIPLRHAANSIATVDFHRAHLNLVRPGLVIYGMYPKHTFPRIIKLKPALELKTRVVFIKDTPPGRSISYGRTFITHKHTKIATLPIGYADGYGRKLSNKAEVLIRGRRARVVGKITMDQTMVDVGHINGVKMGDEVVLIGKQGREEIRAENLARMAESIAYEVVCGISNRVPRVYKY